MITAPFRWAGSKAKVTNELFNYFKGSDVYVEPFLGSGVVLFRLLEDNKYKKYIVNDVNKAIIGFYRAIQTSPKHVIDTLSSYQYLYNSYVSIELKKELYYKVRDSYNNDKQNWTNFWFLMKTGFNGLYRENKKGMYNVPFGFKEKITLDENQIYQIHDLIQCVEFNCMDYTDFIYKVLNETKTRIFIYNDPPYCGSQKYTKDDFNNEKLASFMKSLPIDVAISDIDNDISNHVYHDYFKVILKEVKKIINISSIHLSKEVLYVNYEN
ncbi:MAG: Dam family site-specific DNA-(adenine-N6)-methyltransferase [Acholeplasma sp.]|nr:Dam family site-specific DNA-(adenine-N6)-methyltransferase [Acholeplasma sp.]